MLLNLVCFSARDFETLPTYSLPGVSAFAIYTAVLLSIECTKGMQLTSTGPQTIQKAEGGSAILGCTFRPGPSDTGELDIEWSLVNQDSTRTDQLLLSYNGGKKYIHADSGVMAGLDFTVQDPSKGDASITISPLSPVHGATYQCKVRKSPGVDMSKVSLIVLAKPSVPECWVEGNTMVGESVSLHCESDKGSNPLKYAWTRDRGALLPPIATQNSVTGELLISNHSMAFAGIYLCDVTNAVGAEQCKVNLKANKPPNRAGVIVGTTVGSLLLVVFLLVFISLLVCKVKDSPRHEKEFSNEIKEDATPPDSRPGSRRTITSGSQHPGVTNSHVGHSELQAFHERYTSSPFTENHKYTPVKTPQSLPRFTGEAT